MTGTRPSLPTLPGAGTEQARLEAERALHVLDATPDERFDRITRLASRVLRVPIAVVTIDHGPWQWKKSAIGLSRRLTPREESLSVHALTADPTLIVEDTLTDPRFRDLPVVVERGVRSCLGRPLAVRGHVVATLCVMDTQPRVFTDEEVAAMIDLAHWAAAEMRAEDASRVARELDTLRKRTEMVLSSVAEGIVGIDRSGLVTFVNSATEDKLGWPPGELLGRNMHTVTHARHPDGSPYPAQDCPVTAVLRTGESRRGLHGGFWRFDGSLLPVDWSAGAVMEDDAVVGAVVVFEDASRRVEIERMKADFTAVASHELRTPLTSLKGAIDLLEAGVTSTLPPPAQELVAIAGRNAARLAQLVDDIMDVERLSRSGLPMSRRAVDVAALLADAVGTVEGSTLGKDVRIALEPVDAVVWGDEHRLLQVLTNLLGNALRFSAAGGLVTVRAEQDASAVRIAVVDTGVGIPEHLLDKVFNRFWQVDASNRRSRSGSGLGLSIAKSIVLAHGGQLYVDSTEGVGSTFTVCLPRRAREVPVQVERRGAAEPGLT